MPTFQVDLFVLPPETVRLESCKLQPFTPYRELKSLPESGFHYIRMQKLRFASLSHHFRLYSTKNCLPFIPILASIKTKEHEASLGFHSDTQTHLKLQHDAIIKPGDIQALKSRLSDVKAVESGTKPAFPPEQRKETVSTPLVDSDYERAESQNVYREILDKATPILKGCDVKRFSDITIKSQINTRVCQISNSRSQIRRIHGELLSLIQKAPTGNAGPILLTIALKLLVFFVFITIGSM